jgi:hypothetical protein
MNMIAPTDRSTPAVSRTKVIPVATMAVEVAWTRMLVKFWAVKNCGEIEPNVASSRANRITGAAATSRAATTPPRFQVVTGY